MTNPHTGDMDKIRQWFIDNPDKAITSLELAEQFDLERWQVNNAITWLKKRNLVVPGERFSIGKAHYTPYRLRKESEPRNEFQVATRAAIKMAKTIDTREAFPVLAEISLDRLSPAARNVMRAISATGIPDRIQALDSDTFIVWNSNAQMQDIRRNALGI